MTNGRVGIIIQARMGSSRLPGKVLRKIDNKLLLEHIIDRLNDVLNIVDNIIIATSEKNEDDPIVDFCIRNSISYFRGSENDVLKRYYDAAIEYGIEWIVRVCADNPLIAPESIRDSISSISKYINADVIHNKHRKGYPIGTGIELLSIQALKIAHVKAYEPNHREHVIPYFFENKDDFNIIKLDAPINLQRENYYLTVDYLEDLNFIQKIISHFRKNGILKPSLDEIIDYLDNNPELLEMNHYLHKRENLYYE